MKGVAIPYIIALILGVVVIGLIGYYFLILGGKVSGVGTTTECDTMKLAFCQEWSSYGYSRPVVFKEWDTQKCPDKPATNEKLIEFCKKLLGQPS